LKRKEQAMRDDELRRKYEREQMIKVKTVQDAFIKYNNGKPNKVILI
jgi:hypothetical protein